MQSEGFTIPNEYTNYLRDKNALSTKDYVTILNICKERGISATRHHIKAVIENQNTTNVNIHRVIMDFYTNKVNSIDLAINLISEVN